MGMKKQLALTISIGVVIAAIGIPFHSISYGIDSGNKWWPARYGKTIEYSVYEITDYSWDDSTYVLNVLDRELIGTLDIANEFDACPNWGKGSYMLQQWSTGESWGIGTTEVDGSCWTGIARTRDGEVIRPLLPIMPSNPKVGKEVNASYETFVGCDDADTSGSDSLSFYETRCIDAEIMAGDFNIVWRIGVKGSDGTISNFFFKEHVGLVMFQFVPADGEAPMQFVADKW